MLKTSTEYSDPSFNVIAASQLPTYSNKLDQIRENPF